MPLEANVYGTWVGKQTAKGTPNLTPGKRLVHVGGSVVTNKDQGSEKYSDGTKYGGATDYLNSITGAGDLGIEATPIELAYLLWLFHGAEGTAAVAAVTGPPAVPAMTRHVFTPSVSRGHWFTMFSRVGQTVINREYHSDCLITKLVLEGSSANKVMRVTPSVISLNPGVKFDTDPAASLPTERPFLHTDLSVNAGASSDGSLSVNGQVYRTGSQTRYEFNDAQEPYYGDDTRPADLVGGVPTVTCATTILMDAAGYALFNQMYYGTATPAAGTAPLRSIPAAGSMATVHRQRDNTTGNFNGLQLDVTIPGVVWTLPDSPGPNPSGGTVELPLAGEMRPVSGQSPYTIGVNLPQAVGGFTV